MSDRLKVARGEAWRSFGHKLGIVAVALFAFAGLVWLGDAKHQHSKDEKGEWQLTQVTLMTFAAKAATVAPTATTNPIPKPSSGQIDSGAPSAQNGSAARDRVGASQSRGKGTAQPTQTSSGGDDFARKEPLSDAKLLQYIAVHFTGGSQHVKGTIETKQEFVVAVEQIVDTFIWRDTTQRTWILTRDIEASAGQQRVAGASTRSAVSVTSGPRNNGTVIKAKGQVTPEGAASHTSGSPKHGTEKVAQQSTISTQPDPTIEHYLDRIAGEESLARARIAGAHALVEATATQIEESKDSAPVLLSMFDEKHPLYVLYEISWYMLLALAVLSSSWLLVTIFTVLPFTDAEGYWTKRIGDLLDKFAPGVSSVLLPLASAALVATTVFTGTGFATVPGGYARAVTNRITIDDRSTHTRIEQPPPSLAAQDLEKALATLQTTVAGQMRESEGHVLRDLVDVQNHLLAADETQRHTLTEATDAKTRAKWAEDKADQACLNAALAANQTEQVPAIEGTAMQLAFEQAALVDTRGYFKRAFGRTLFKVGPGAVHAMAAKLHVALNVKGEPAPYDVKDPPELSKEVYERNAALVRVLGRATLILPKHSGDFRLELNQLALKEVKKDEVAQLLTLLRDNDRSLLHLCALPRD